MGLELQHQHSNSHFEPLLLREYQINNNKISIICIAQTNSTKLISPFTPAVVSA